MLLVVTRRSAHANTADPEDWYANLLWFDRRKCLLLTHSATLFTIFEADVTASSLRGTRQLVTDLARTDLTELNRSLRRNINSARGYRPPIELTASRLTA